MFQNQAVMVDVSNKKMYMVGPNVKKILVKLQYAADCVQEVTGWKKSGITWAGYSR